MSVRSRRPSRRSEARAAGRLEQARDPWSVVERSTVRGHTTWMMLRSDRDRFHPERAMSLRDRSDFDIRVGHSGRRWAAVSLRMGVDVDRAPSAVGGEIQPEHLHLIERELNAEFHGRLDPEEISRLASDSLTRFEDATVRTFVPILAIRTARRLARAELAMKDERLAT